MTIASTITSKQYTGNGVTTQFAFPNKIFAATDLVVTLFDLLGNPYSFVNFLNATTGLSYTVQSVDVDAGCTVVFSGAITTGWTIDIRSLIPDLQSTSIKNQGSFLPELHEEAFDRATRMIQDLLRLSYLYGIHGPDIETAPWPSLPGISTRKGMALMFDAITGLPTIGVPNTQTITTGLLAPFLALSQTGAEAGASPPVVPTNLAYPPGNVLRYGADRTGATDSTPAWTSALAQRVNGGEEIRFPGGLYKGNFVVTGQNVVVNIQEPYYEDTNTVGFIANNAALPVWSIGDGSTLTSSIMFRGGLKMHGGGTAQKGIIFNGVQNCQMDSLIVRGFTTYGINYTASLTRPTAYVWIGNCRVDPWAGAASAIGLVMTQPANYPTSYATAFYLLGGAIQSNLGTLWAVQINANCTLQVSNSYWTMGHNVGINFPDAAGTGQIVCDNLSIDTLGTSNDVLVTCAAAANFPLANNMYGFFTLNGKVSINGVVSTAALTGTPVYLGNRAMLLNASVTGSLDFQDSSAAAANQQIQVSQPMNLSRSGNNLFLKNTVGAVLSQATSLNLTNAAGNADAPLVFGITLIKTLTGAGAPAVAAPVGSLYLRSDGGASTTLYVKESGTGTTGWVAK